jgi:hypothetical protein
LFYVMPLVSGPALRARGGPKNVPSAVHGPLYDSRMRLVIATCAALLAFTGGAAASQSVMIGARFAPYRLGAPAAVKLGMTVTPRAGSIPSPLTGVDFRYPTGLGIATSGLGTASCTAFTLDERGPQGCPRNSIMGRGRATARFRVGPEIFSEPAEIGIVAGPSTDGRLHLLVSATGLDPVIARIVMQSTLERGHLRIAVPLVPSLPQGEDVAVTAVRVTLGGHLTYTERRAGRTVRYEPRGVGIPRHCPKGGFHFSGRFTFLDGTSATAAHVVRCPRGSG